MSLIDLSVETTPVSNKLLPKLDINPAMSPLLSDSSTATDLFAAFFASTTVEDIPLLSAWLNTNFNEDLIATSLVADRPKFRFVRVRTREEPQPEKPAERTYEDRVQLLARKYVAREKFSPEESARLAIVTERVRKLLPAVSAAEYEALEKSLEEANDISATNAALRARLKK
jgi:hypothetical protein